MQGHMVHWGPFLEVSYQSESFYSWLLAIVVTKVTEIKKGIKLSAFPPTLNRFPVDILKLIFCLSKEGKGKVKVTYWYSSKVPKVKWVWWDLQAHQDPWEFLAGVVFLVSKVIFSLLADGCKRKLNIALFQYRIFLFDCFKMSSVSW